MSFYYALAYPDDKKLTRSCTYIPCKHVIVAPDHAPIKVDGSYNNNSCINEKAFGKSNLC